MVAEILEDTGGEGTESAGRDSLSIKRRVPHRRTRKPVCIFMGFGFFLIRRGDLQDYVVGICQLHSIISAVAEAERLLENHPTSVNILIGYFQIT